MLLMSTPISIEDPYSVSASRIDREVYDVVVFYLLGRKYLLSVFVGASHLTSDRN